MSLPGIILRKLLGVFRIFFTCLKSVFRWRSCSSNIGELPYTIIRDKQEDMLDSPRSIGSPSNQEWNSWSEESFGVESRIAEYRRQRQTAAVQPADSLKADVEPDFFGDMQPELKPTKKLKLRGPNEGNVPSNLFQVRDNSSSRLDASWNTSNLGELEQRAPSRGIDDGTANSWDDGGMIDTSVVDAMEREQRRAERDAKHRERIADHERRLAEKRRELPAERGFGAAVRGLSTSVEMPP